MLAAVMHGLTVMRRARRLTLVVWAYGLLLALAAALPMARWWGSATAHAPEFDRLLRRFDLGVLAELTTYDTTSVWTLGVWWGIGVAGLALVGNAWMNAGIIGVLADDNATGGLLTRFGQGAGTFFGRFLRLLLYVVLFDIAVLVSWSMLASALGAYVREHGSSQQQLLVGALGLAGAAVVVAYSSLVLDYARIRVVSERSRWPLAAFLHSVWFVGRRAWLAIGPPVLLGLLLVLLLAVYGVTRGWVDGTTWPGILVAIALQQAFMYARSAWRVGLLAAELTTYRRTHPRWTTWGRVGPGIEESPPASTR